MSTYSLNIKNRMQQIITAFIILCNLLLVNSCSSSTTSTTASSSKLIIAYSLNGISGSIIGNNISVIMPYGTNLTNLIASYTTTGASVTANGVTQVSGQTANNYSNPVVDTVIAYNGTTANYTVRVTIASSNSKSITSYSINKIKGVITGSNISVVMPYGTDVKNLVATFTTTGQSISVGNVIQTSGQTANNFSSAVTYTVTANDKTIKNYIVNVTIASNSSKLITSYSLNGVSGKITNRTIAVTMPYGTDLTSLIASFTTTGQSVTVGGVVQLSDETENNFMSPLTYTVAAANGTSANYIVTVFVASSASNAITSYALDGVSGVITNNNILVTMPSGTDVTNLIATYTTTGQSVTVGGIVQTSGQTENNFTSSVLYAVTAANGTTAIYTVTVKVAASSAKSITSYSLNGVSGVISGSSISVVMPYGTDVTSLVATYTTTGQSVSIGSVIQVSGQTENNFTSSVVYTVTAFDKTVANYTVTVTVSGSPAKDITSYFLSGFTGAISGQNISIVLPSGVSLTNLIATFTTTGQSVSVGGIVQISGQTENDFTNPVVYIVTAADGSTATYTVTVQVNLTVSLIDSPLENALSPSGNYLYAATSAGYIDCFAISPTNGALSYAGNTQIKAPTTGVAVSPSNNYIYAAAGANISWFSVGVGCPLTNLGQISLSNVTNYLAIAPSGNYLYTSTSEGYIGWMSIGSGGALTYQGQTKLADVPLSIIVSPNGNYLYASTTGGYIDWFSIGSGGALTFVGNFKLEAYPQALAVSPDGSTLYVSTVIGNYINWFNIESNGSITLKGTMPVSIGIYSIAGISVLPSNGLIYLSDNNPQGYNLPGMIQWMSIPSSQ